MALSTRSKFYYGPTVDPAVVYINFSEGGPEIIAKVNAGPYSPVSFATEVARAMSEVGTQTYYVSFNRTTRTFTVYAANNFELLIASGTHASSNFWAYMGFIGGVDLTGANSYSGAGSVGTEYKPQFYLLDYVPTSMRKEAVDSTINVSGSGRVEVVSFGLQQFMECSIDLINSYTHGADSLIEQNKDAVDQAISFLSNAILKGTVEFMEDRDTPDSYELMILESTQQNQKGIGFKLVESLEVGAGYYSTGKLVFRKVTQ